MYSDFIWKLEFQLKIVTLGAPTITFNNNKPKAIDVFETWSVAEYSIDYYMSISEEPSAKYLAIYIRASS